MAPPPAPPRRLVPAKPAAEIADKTSLLELNDRICKWPLGHPGEPDFHFCGDQVNPGFPYCEAETAQLRGYHRSFCVFSHGHRGTPQRPGLVLGLDSGGTCRGIAYRVPAVDVPASYLTSVDINVERSL